MPVTNDDHMAVSARNWGGGMAGKEGQRQGARWWQRGSRVRGGSRKEGSPAAQPAASVNVVLPPSDRCCQAVAHKRGNDQYGNKQVALLVLFSRWGTAGRRLLLHLLLLRCWLSPLLLSWAGCSVLAIGAIRTCGRTFEVGVWRGEQKIGAAQLQGSAAKTGGGGAARACPARMPQSSCKLPSKVDGSPASGCKATCRRTRPRCCR